MRLVPLPANPLAKLLAPLATKFANIANNSKQNKSLGFGRGIFVFVKTLVDLYKLSKLN